MNNNGGGAGRDITVLPPQMRALARYEETFDALLDDPLSGTGRLVFPEAYQMTLEDLSAALENIREKNPTVRQFGENWFFPISQLEAAFGIPAARGEPGEDAPPAFSGLAVTAEDVFREAWWDLEDMWSFADEEEHTADRKELQKALEDISFFLKYRGRPVEERDFPTRVKERYISAFDNDSRVNEASEAELRLCRRFTEELCAQGSLAALRLKGYACYGGNRLYPCDWHASRDCITTLYEKTDAPQYANTLGYICYYGRCTGGVPEYEKAMEMFIVAAANGLYEGAYKLGDMFRHGYACRQSPRTARALYSMVYDDCLKRFLAGDDTNFADAALRVGNVYLHGIGGGVDPVRACAYYLQALYAAKKRAESREFFGDATVLLGIQKALEETRAALPEDFFREELRMDRPQLFWDFVENGYCASLTLVPAEDGNLTVRLWRRPRPSGEREDLLLTWTPLEYCALVTEFEMTAVAPVTSLALGEEKAVWYDLCGWNDTEGRMEFHFDDRLIGWIACEEYLVRRPRRDEPRGERLRLVSVTFRPGGRIYDYLCDLPEVSVGDLVIVPGYDGETLAEVQEVFLRYESELVLPRSRYKRVLRRAEDK